jgi:hypothetical protein
MVSREIECDNLNVHFVLRIAWWFMSVRKSNLYCGMCCGRSTGPIVRSPTPLVFSNNRSRSSPRSVRVVLVFGNWRNFFCSYRQLTAAARHRAPATGKAGRGGPGLRCPASTVPAAPGRRTPRLRRASPRRSPPVIPPGPACRPAPNTSSSSLSTRVSRAGRRSRPPRTHTHLMRR